MTRWIWADLVAFDAAAADYGLDDYLARCGFVPDVVSLLLFNPEVVHGHDGLSTARPLPPDCCSYGAHPYGYDRPRQEWSSHQLRGLVRALTERGIAPYLSVMDLFRTPGWLGDHPEVWHVGPRGRWQSVCPYKRLADGTWYQDFFTAQLARTLTDYGFAGFHQPDGYCHPRPTLYQGDYSDDLIDQYLAAGGELPADLQRPCGDDPATISRRGEWLWANQRRAWIGFYAARTTHFCRTVAEAVHGVGGQLWLNNAMTREPVEALYRYGTDYRRLAEFADGFVAETVAPTVTIGGESGMPGEPHHELQAMLLLFSEAVAPRPVVCLNGVHDAHEQWDVLRHGPALIERELTEQGHLFRWTTAGPVRCAAGPVVCLGDGLAPHEWDWLRGWWSRAVEAVPSRLHSATLAWSPAMVDAELDDYLATRRPTTCKLLAELLAHGAPLRGIASPADALSAPGPLVVLNPAHFPADELRRLLTCGQPVLLAGAVPAGLTAAGPLVPRDGEPAPELPEPPTYVQPLAFSPLDATALASFAAQLREAVTPVRVSPDSVFVQALELDDRLRLLLSTDSPRYVITRVEIGSPIDDIRVVGPFPRTPPQPAGTGFSLRVPPRGIVVVDVVLQESLASLWTAPEVVSEVGDA